MENYSEILATIYIGQNIRDEGLLQSTLAEAPDKIRELIGRGLIRENQWYSHQLYLTTQEGANLARSIVTKKVENSKLELENFLKNFPPRLSAFLIHDYLAKSLDFPEYFPQYMFDHWLDQWKVDILKDNRIWQKRTEILLKLEKLGLSIITNNYVSTRGGELRDSRFVICPEIRQLLLEICPVSGLTEQESRQCRICYFLKRVQPWLNWSVTEEVRKRYLDEMQSLDLSEDDIRRVVNELAERGITESYVGITAIDKKPFLIKDRVNYEFSIQNILIYPIITNLLESKKNAQIEKENGQTEILQRVIRLVEAKYSLTRNAGFLGIDLFDSTPDIEICITRMLKAPTTDGELNEFIGILYNYIIDRSKERLLKIGNMKTGEKSSLEDKISARNIRISPELRSEFERSIQDLRLINNLRNKLSHSKNTKDWEEIANIYRKIINKPIPKSKEDYIETQLTLLEKAAQSLESLSTVFTTINT